MKATLRSLMAFNILRNEIQLHGRDSLATALFNYCIYKKLGQGCNFCIIDVSQDIIFRDPLQIAKSIETIKDLELRKCFNIEDKYNPELRMGGWC